MLTWSCSFSISEGHRSRRRHATIQEHPDDREERERQEPGAEEFEQPVCVVDGSILDAALFEVGDELFVDQAPRSEGDRLVGSICQGRPLDELMTDLDVPEFATIQIGPKSRVGDFRRSGSEKVGLKQKQAGYDHRVVADREFRSFFQVDLDMDA